MKITSDEFIERTLDDPTWCSKLSEPTEVIEPIVMYEFPITALSPLLTFTGKDRNGDVASFTDCPKLIIAEGIFHGQVDFTSAGIEKIGDLKITQTNKSGQAACFRWCKYLEIAEGNYPGFVDFEGTGIKETKNLSVTGKNVAGYAVTFTDCCNLTKIRGSFLGEIGGKEPLLKEYHQYMATKKTLRAKAQEPIIQL